jgi:alpha-1,2-rhamnosyltransferase
MDPRPSHLGIYKIPHHLLRWSTLSKSLIQGKTISPASEQILILPDAYWTRRGIWKTVQSHRNAGALVATVVYDLIPLTHPQYVGQKRSQKFQTYLDQVIRHSDTIIAISQTVRDDVRNYIAKQPDRVDLCQDVRSFVLGAELAPPNPTEQSQSIRPCVESLFDSTHNKPPYLMIASFDPRKNHEQALDAFDLLWKKHPELNLCFAGRSGSMCSDLMNRIEQHPKLNRGLWVFHDLSDVELHHAYQRCSGVLLPSIVEGFGLPIVESLWHGRKTFASDTPIHREVGSKHCEYFALHDPQDLAHRIETWEHSHRTADQGSNPTADSTLRFVPTTWRQSTSQLVDAVLEVYESKRSPQSRRAA